MSLASRRLRSLALALSRRFLPSRRNLVAKSNLRNQKWKTTRLPAHVLDEFAQGMALVCSKLFRQRDDDKLVHALAFNGPHLLEHLVGIFKRLLVDRLEIREVA